MRRKITHVVQVLMGDSLPAYAPYAVDEERSCCTHKVPGRAWREGLLEGGIEGMRMEGWRGIRWLHVCGYWDWEVVPLVRDVVFVAPTRLYYRWRWWRWSRGTSLRRGTWILGVRCHRYAAP